MIINSLRTYGKTHTDSRVFLNGEHFGYGLEDAGRPHGVKIAGETAIPEGTYNVSISYSPAFEREMIVIYNIDDDHSIERHGVRFTGIRAHGGNNIAHTAGCLMVARNTDNAGKIWGSLETELFQRVKEVLDGGSPVLWVISEDA